MGGIRISYRCGLVPNNKYDHNRDNKKLLSSAARYFRKWLMRIVRILSYNLFIQYQSWFPIYSEVFLLKTIRPSFQDHRIFYLKGLSIRSYHWYGISPCHRLLEAYWLIGLVLCWNRVLHQAVDCNVRGRGSIRKIEAKMTVVMLFAVHKIQSGFHLEAEASRKSNNKTNKTDFDRQKWCIFYYTAA